MPGTVRVANLRTACERVQAEMRRAVGTPGGRQGRLSAETDSLLERIRGYAARVEDICRAHGASPDDLPGPSRRAYYWLRFLADPGHLSAHLEALGAAEALAEGLAATGRGQVRPASVRVDFFHTKVLFRVRPAGDDLQVVASEGFIAAPREVLADLVLAAAGSRPRRKTGAAEDRVRRLARVRQWAAGEDYRRILLLLERNGGAAPPPARGRHHDLEAVFERVNRAYFGGLLDRPALTWNRLSTRRKLGHYEPASDTVMLSVTLDRAEVPAYAVDYVMYHELLHKHLGIGMANGRQRAHTAAFRRAERQFRDYEAAKRFLDSLGRRASSASPRRRR